jgi:hypothetical protein
MTSELLNIDNTRIAGTYGHQTDWLQTQTLLEVTLGGASEDVDCDGLGIVEVLDVHEGLDEEQLAELEVEGIMAMPMFAFFVLPGTDPGL